MLTEIWNRLNDSTQFLIAGICLLIAAGGIGYMRYIIHNARVRNRLRRIKAASKPVDYTQIDFTTYDSKARIKRIGHELREMSRKEGTNFDNHERISNSRYDWRGSVQHREGRQKGI